jgi:hypothetical protein
MVFSWMLIHCLKILGKFVTCRILLSDDNMLTFMISKDVDGVEAHFQEIARILGIPDDSSFRQLGVCAFSPLNCIEMLYDRPVAYIYPDLVKAGIGSILMAIFEKPYKANK